MFIITRKSTVFKKKNDSEQVSLGNQIVWRFNNEQKVIVAIGYAHEWASTEPLPKGSVVVDLIEETIKDPSNAIELWESFLSYISSKAHSTTWQMMCASLKKTTVQISIEDPNLARAVRNCLLKCRYPRMKIE